MDTNGQVLEGFFTMPSTKSMGVASAIAPRFTNAHAERHSAANILKWTQYLPEDCITRMIEMGWDLTT